MESPGEYLKREREHRGITLDHVHEVTRIQKKYLEALEADEYDRLPHPTFIKGFIKSYCRLLGVDENDAALRYDIFMRESGGRQEGDGPHGDSNQDGYHGEPHQAKRNRIIIGACVAAGVALIVIFYSVSSRESAPTAPPQAAPAATAPAETASGDAASEETGHPVTQVAEPSPEPPRASEKAAPGARPAAVAPAKERTPAPEPVRVKPAAVREAAPAPQAAPAVQSAPAATDAPAVAAGDDSPQAEVKERPAAADNKHRLSLSADDTVWVQVSIDGGEPVDVMFRKGESHAWTAINGFTLVIGNVAGVSLTLDGTDLPPLGKKGEVVRLELPGRD